MTIDRTIKSKCASFRARIARQTYAIPTTGTAWRVVLLATLITPIFGLLAERVQAGDCADVDLVLAIDGSGSIDHDEFALQQRGYSSAFRRRDVQDALMAAGTVDVAVVLWGDSEIEPQVLSWARLIHAHSAEALATRLDRMVRKVHGDTGIGRGLAVALNLFEAPGQCGLRKIVNVSGGRIRVGHRPPTPQCTACLCPETSERHGCDRQCAGHRE